MENIDKLNENIDFFNQHSEEMELKDKLVFLLAMDEFADLVQKIRDKYDTSKPFRFEYRRLD